MSYKKVIVLFIIMATSLLTSGCWDYVGINELTIVSGMAIDKKDDKYKITFEIIDNVKSNDQTGIKTRLIDYEGKSIYEIIKGIKNIIDKKIYLGNNEIIIISEDVAKEEGINYVILTFLRGVETRETIYVAISKEKEASKLLEVDGISDSILSFELKEIIADDQNLNLTTRKFEFYKVYNTLIEDKASLVLPALKLTKSDGKKVNELDGVAVFKKDKLIGYLSQEESKYYAIAMNEAFGGYLGLNPSKDKDSLISFEIKESKSKTSYKFEDDRLKVNVNIRIKLLVAEYDDKFSAFSQEELRKLEIKINKNIQKNIKKIFEKAQNDFESDIFAIEEMVYKSNYKLYKQLKKNWEHYYKNIDFNIKADSTIINTRLIR